MTRLLWVVIWLLISAFSFYVLGRVENARERSGRKLTGIGALLVAAAMAVPESPDQLTFGDVLSVVAAVLATVLLALGLYRAYPTEWRRR